MTKFRAITLPTLLLLASSAPSRAWGPVGHKAVAMLAQSRLTPETLHAIRALLGRQDINLAWIANCADAFDHSNGHIVCAGTITVDGSAEQSKPWHYINIPISDYPNPAPLSHYCKGGINCVTAQIKEDIRVLQDPAASTQEKQVALMFLVHFVGDAHQPLHCADDKDEGGNKKTTNVILKGTKTMNLHQVWDHAVDNPEDEDEALALAEIRSEDKNLPEDARRKAKEIAQKIALEAETLAKQLGKDLQNTKSSPSAEIASWTQGDDLPTQMALESLDIAARKGPFGIYSSYSYDHGLIADPMHPTMIGKDYHDRMRPIAHKRLEKAGVRLAFLLEQAFSTPTGATAPPTGRPSRLHLEPKKYSDPFAR